MADQLIKDSYDVWTLVDVNGQDFYDSWCKLRSENDHLATLALNRVRRWLGARKLISQEIVALPKKKLTAGDFAIIFQSINKIPEYFLPHFRNTATFCKEKIPRHLAPLPDTNSHNLALLIHSFVHRELRSMVAQPVQEPELWNRVMAESNRLASNFENPFCERHPELWGIDPAEGQWNDVVDMYDRYQNLKFQMTTVVQHFQSELPPSGTTTTTATDSCLTHRMPTDIWMKDYLSQNHQQENWSIILYAWLFWKKYLRNPRYRYLIDHTFSTAKDCDFCRQNPNPDDSTQFDDVEKYSDWEARDDCDDHDDVNNTEEPFIDMNGDDGMFIPYHLPPIVDTQYQYQDNIEDQEGKKSNSTPPVGIIAFPNAIVDSLPSSITPPVPISPTSTSTIEPVGNPVRLFSPPPSSSSSSSSSSLPPPSAASSSSSSLSFLPPSLLPQLPSIPPLLLPPAGTQPRLLPDYNSNVSQLPYSTPSTTVETSRLGFPDEFDYSPNFYPPQRPLHTPNTATTTSSRASSSQSKLAILQAKARYYRLKNARKVLKDMKKGLLDKSMFTRDEIRDLRKRCYEAMIK